MESRRKSQKICCPSHKIRNLVFDLIFIFSTNSITNRYLLLVLDLLEIVTLPYFYINPIYSHLRRQDLFQIYFQKVHPVLYFNEQNAQVDSYPICLTIFSLCSLLLLFFNKSTPIALIIITTLLLSLIPFFIIRIASEIVNLTIYVLYIKIIGSLFLILTIFAICMVLLKYNKFIKITDFAIAILLFVKIHQYALLSLLALKIIATFFLSPNIYAKQLKLSLQISLWFSNLLLIFVKPILLNYVMMALLILVSFAYTSFLIFLRYQHQDISEIEEQQLQSLTQKYSFDEIEYFKKINSHIIECSNTVCNCRQIFKVQGPKQLRIWAKQFHKNILQLSAKQIDKTNSKYFQIQTQYIKICLQKQQPDFEGFVRLNQLISTNIIQAYHKYHYSKQYKCYLEKTAPKIINMNVIDQKNGASPYEDLLQLENSVCFLIQRLKLFWQQLLASQDYKMLSSLIQQISQKVNTVKQKYLSIEQRYDEKEEAQYYYNIFRLLLLHERPGDAIANHHKASYIIVSMGDRIVNITTSITHLLQANRNKIIGKNYNSFMLLAYANDHTMWKKQFMAGYKPDKQSSFVKTINVGPSQIKVARMTHTLLPHFDIITDENFQNTDDVGVTIVTLIQHNVVIQNEQRKEQKDIFHLLVCRNSLDVIAYESSIFQYFETKPNTGNINKILRANLLEVFPNLNKEALLKTSKSQHKLIARANKQFFKVIQFQPSQKPAIKIIDPTNKHSNQENQLLVVEVPSCKNQELNLLLLRFQVIFQNQDNQIQKQTSKDLQFDEVKKKTLKKIVESACQDNEKPQSSYSIQNYFNILIWASFVLVFALNFISLILFHYTYSNINSEMVKYDFSTQFYIDFEYTKTYYLKFKLGENRIKQMQNFWNYNINYPDAITVFKQINNKIFKQKFNQYLNQFQVHFSFSKLQQSIKAIKMGMSDTTKILYVLFFCCLGLIIINFAISIYHYFKSQSDLAKILQSFLSLDQDQIKNNLKKIQGLQSFLQLYDFEETIQEQIQQKHDDLSCSFFVKNNRKGLRESQSLKQSSSKRRKLKNKVQEKQLFQSMIQKYFENIGARKQHDLNFIAKISKNQKSNLVIKKIPSISCNEDQIKKKNESKMSKLRDEQFQKQQKNVTISHGFSKNYSQILHSFTGFLLKLMYSILILLLLNQILQQTIFCISLKQNMNYEPVLFFETVQNQHAKSNYDSKQDKLSNFDENIMQMIQKLSKKFDSFHSLIRQISASNHSLCQYSSYLQKQNLYFQCLSKKYLFNSGFASLISYAQDKLRRVSTGQYQPSYLKNNSDFTLVFQIFFTVFETRNKLFSQIFQSYTQKNKQAFKIISIILCFIFVLCLYFSIKQSQQSKSNSQKIKSLFKLIPPFMREKFQQNLNRKQQNDQ